MVSAFLCPGATCDTSSVPTAPEASSTTTAARSSVAMSTFMARCSYTVRVEALSRTMRSPETNSTRSTRCDPMSANARDGPPSEASTRQSSSCGVASQSCR